MGNRKLQIVEENMNLAPNEIKKELKKIYPNISNEDVIKLIIEVSKKRENPNEKMLVAKRDNRGRKPAKPPGHLPRLPRAVSHLRDSSLR